MMRRAALVGALALLLGHTPLAAQRSGRRVVLAADIAAAGWHRVGDIALALAPGSVASIDAFNHSLTSSRVPFRDAGGATVTWHVRLDGQLVPMQVGGLWMLDAIPVAITQLDSVVITQAPGLVDGRPSFLGVIDLYTRRPRHGASAVADYQHGDETGDPGPYRYTPRSTPNVEKLGPFTSGAAALASDHASVDVAARYASLNVTDQRIIDRFVGSFSQLQQDVNASGGSGVATLSALEGTHFVVAGRGRVTGLMRFPAFDLDQSARVIASHAGVSGSMRLAQRSWRYAASATQLEVDQLGSAIPFVVGHDRLLTDAFVEAGLTQTLQLGLGVNGGRQELPTGTASRYTTRGWATYSIPAGMAQLAVERSLGDVRLSGSVRGERQLADSTVLGVSATMLSSWSDENNAWMDGASLADTHARAISGGEARVDLTTREILTVRPTWYGRAFSLGPVGQGGRQNGIAGGLVASTSAGRRVSIWGRAEVTQLIGDVTPGETSTPRGFVEANAGTRAPGNFSLWATARYAPATVWPELEPGASVDVPEMRFIGFTVNKLAWGDRIRAQLAMRNVLNAPERGHPLGAQWNLRTHLAVTVALPSGMPGR